MERYVALPYTENNWSVWDNKEREWLKHAPVVKRSGKAKACAMLMNGKGDQLEIIEEDMSKYGLKNRFYLIKTPISYGGFCIQFESRDAVEEFIRLYSPA